MAYTFRIVKDNYFTKTMADRRLPSTDSVLTLLKWLERHMADRYVISKSTTYSTFQVFKLKGRILAEAIWSKNYDRSKQMLFELIRNSQRILLPSAPRTKLS